SATDVIARSVSNELSARLGQPVIIENRPGAGGTIAAAQVAKSAPDGYTLLVNSSGHTVNPWIYTTLSYDTANDLKGVTILARQPPHGAGGRQPAARVGAARRADHRGGGLQGQRLQLLGRPARPGRHATGGHRAAEQGASRRARPTRGQGAAGQDRR